MEDVVAHRLYKEVDLKHLFRYHVQINTHLQRELLLEIIEEIAEELYLPKGLL